MGMSLVQSSSGIGWVRKESKMPVAFSSPEADPFFPHEVTQRLSESQYLINIDVLYKGNRPIIVV